MDLQYMLISAAIAVSLKLIHIVYLTSPFMLDGFYVSVGKRGRN